MNSIVNSWGTQSVDFAFKVSHGPQPSKGPKISHGKSDGRFLLYGVKSQDNCLDFLSYHFLSCHITVSSSAKKILFLCTICRQGSVTHMRLYQVGLSEPIALIAADKRKGKALCVL